MQNFLQRTLGSIDWLLLGPAVLLSFAGLLTMDSFTSQNIFFDRQIIWIGVSLLAYIISASIDWRFLRRREIVVSVFLVAILLLTFLFLAGSIFKGARSWFDFGAFSFQPVDVSKIALVLLLAKYFSRRHVEIAHIRHVVVSGAYALIIFILVLLQPDFGSAIIIASIWLLMVLISGISKKHLLLVLLLATMAISSLWFFAFEDYQKQRVITFLNPLTDIQGAGYNAYQSTIAVGSGELLGKGIGYGTQSKLRFLPEYQTDFIFASFAEEWGFIGVIIIFLLYATLMYRIIIVAHKAETNFETLFCIGVGTIFVSHFFINVGMNVGLLPVTGITLPFMSYGGSHLFSEFLALGVISGMRQYSRAVNRESIKNELVGVGRI